MVVRSLDLARPPTTSPPKLGMVQRHLTLRGQASQGREAKEVEIMFEDLR
jgi:hypothetical protein